MTAALWFVTEDREIPITNMFDMNGDETGEPEEAWNIVGPLPDGQWLASECRPGDIVKREALAS